MMRPAVARTLMLAAGLVFLAISSQAQAQSRADSLRELRRAKIDELHPPPEPGWLERMLTRIQRISTGGTGTGFYGFRPRLGGLGPGAGLSAGLGFEPFSGEDSRQLRADALVSTRLYWGAGLMGGFDSGRSRLFGYARYVHRPEETFFGLGMDSHRDLESDYRLNHGVLGVLGGVGPETGFSAGASVEYSILSPGPGRNDDLPDVDAGPGGAGVSGEAARYAAVGGWIEFDTREPETARRFVQWAAPGVADLVGLPLVTDRGVFLQARATRHLATDGDLADFTRLSIQGQQHLSFRHGVNVFVVREFLALTDGDRLPFFLLPALGGAGTLRGYALHRFRDRNALMVNAEYRWQIWLFADVALFSDVGQVFDRFEEVAIEDMAASYGVGLRLRTATRGLLRLDVARSSEGTQVHLRLSSYI